MNSAFLEYLVTGEKPSTADSIYFEAPFYEKIPPLTGIFSRSKNIQFKELSFSAGKDALTLVHKSNPEMDFKWDNIIGVTTESIPASTYPSLPATEKNKELHIMKIHFFGKRDELKSVKREEFDREFYSFDYDTVMLWKNFILQMANNPRFLPSDYKDIRNVPHFKRLLLAFINPNAGQGKAPQVWNTAKQFLQKAGCTFVEVFTTKPGHARDYLLKGHLTELKEIDGIVTVSGDGIPHEVVNGIFGRPDWENLKDIPVGALLGGSASALAVNQLARSKEAFDLISGCYLVAKGKTIKSDVTVYEGLGEEKIYSFLSLVYGNMARVDIESEKLRRLGNMRFYLYGVYAIARLKTDQGKLTYSKKASIMPKLDEEIEGEDWTEVNDSFCYFLISNLAHLDASSKGAPLAEFDDGYNHCLYVKGEKNKRMSLLNILLKLDGGLFEGEHPAESTGLNFEKIKAFRFEPLSGGYYSIDGEKYEAKKIQGVLMERVLTVYSTK